MSRTLLKHLNGLASAVPLEVDKDIKWYKAHSVLLPFGYNWAATRILFFISPDYPLTPPGLTQEYGIYLPKGLTYFGNTIPHYYESIAKWPGWSWFCYHDLKWDYYRDNLITLFERVRTDIWNPYS